MADAADSGLDSPLRIAEGLDVVVLSDNEVLVQFGSRSYPSQLFRDTDLSGLLGRVFGRLQHTPAIRAEILSSVTADRRDEAAELVDSLLDQGILARNDESAVEQYLGYSFTGDTRLADYRVSLIGSGPVGAQTAELLLQHGIGAVDLLEGRQPDAVWRALPRANGPGRPRDADLPRSACATTSGPSDTTGSRQLSPSLTNGRSRTRSRVRTFSLSPWSSQTFVSRTCSTGCASVLTGAGSMPSSTEARV